jgi:hypothetical protein
MTGRELLERLPETVKQQIIQTYGSLDQYYEFVFKLYESDRQWFSVKTDEGRQKRQQIQNKLFDLEDELETFGIEDGHAVLTEISSDHGEKVLAGFLKKMGM